MTPRRERPTAMNTLARALLIGLVAGVVSCGGGGGGETLPPDEPLYLVFMLEPIATERPGEPPATPKEAFTRYVDLLSRRLGVHATEHRQLGFGILLSPWLQTPQEIGLWIDDAFDVARERSIAVHFAIESHYNWEGRPDLWNYFDPAGPGYDPANADNVEWSDWGRHPYPARFIDWGTPQRLAPHMCYASPRIRAEVARLAKDVIGARIAARVAELRAAGLGRLFSGITVTSEPSLDDYSSVGAIDPALAAFIDAQGATRSQLGYCALTNAGFSSGAPPVDLRASLADANRGWVALWASGLRAGGIDRERLFTHIAAGASLPGSAGVNFTNAPLSVAFVADARPGFTTYAQGDLAQGFAPLYAELEQRRAGPWAGVEASFIDARGGAIDAETYLRWHFDHGAVRLVMNAGATGDLGMHLAQVNWSSAAVAAYRRFLSNDLRFESHP